MNDKEKKMATKKKEKAGRRTPQDLAQVICDVARVLRPGGMTSEQIQAALGVEKKVGAIGPLDLPLRLGTEAGIFRRRGVARATKYSLAMPTARAVDVVYAKVYGA